MYLFSRIESKMISLISFIFITLCAKIVHCQNGGEIFFPSQSTITTSSLKSCNDACEMNYYFNPQHKTMNGTDFDNDCCLPCPQHAFCNNGATIETLSLEDGFWRASDKTTTFYACSSLTCGNKYDDSKDCAEGHSGLLCEVCDYQDQYFDQDYRHCIDCPSIWPVLTKALPKRAVLVGNTQSYMSQPSALQTTNSI